MPTNIELANAIRILTIDTIQKSGSGHPGMPMGMADVAAVLWRNFLKHSPKNPKWWDRDRFVLSNGHGSMLLYALLYLSGYDLKIDDLKSFRQLNSKTPGHPEYAQTPGVETTTGPLGQGFANAVGMAIAENSLGAQFNQKDFKLFDHYTYVFAGDGCLMEGISHEVASLAGTLGLGKLIVFWDDNGISIDGKVKDWFSEDTVLRFKAYGWQVIDSINGHNHDVIHHAITEARHCLEHPSLICCRTQIAYGAPNLSGSEKAHGTPLGDNEIQATRRQLGWDSPPFVIPKSIQVAWHAVEAGEKKEQLWQTIWSHYKTAYPNAANELSRRMQGKLPQNLSLHIRNYLKTLTQNSQNIATRAASQQMLNQLSSILPELIGGSADLTGSNLTKFENAQIFSKKNSKGQYIYFGVREFGMSGMLNGIALHSGFIPYGGTFLVFSDYARSAIRMSAMMQQRVIYVLTHDSIGLGEDGPTHQPIEHLAMLRMTPNLSVWRPADDIETCVAWRMALENKKTPTVLALSRQKTPRIVQTSTTIDKIKYGAYILKEPKNSPRLILIATGTEVALALAVSEKLATLPIRVVSMPSTDFFLKQSTQYQSEILPDTIRKRVAIEAAAMDYWYRFVGLDGKIFAMNSFGKSACAPDLYDHFGFSVEKLSIAIQLYYQKGVLHENSNSY